MRPFNLTTLLFLYLMLCVQLKSATANNVLLIIADDLGIDSLTAFNSDPAALLPPTPTIDSLRTQGIRFTRYYAYSVCSPTRASILTGRYSFRTGVLSVENNTLKPNEFTLPEALLESGVISNRMACIGKWHLDTDANAPNVIGGWPHFSGSLGGAIPDYHRWQKTVNGNTTNAYSVYATSDNVNDSIAWTDQQGTNSWFLWLAFNAPHTPHHRPPNNLHDYDFISDDGANSSRPHFEAMVQAMDTEMARLLTHVDLATTTLIFMGDNGTLRGVLQPPFPATHGKGTAYEGGIRVPMIIAGAAIANGLSGSSYDGPLHACDLYATILELFGVTAEAWVPEQLQLDSRSFAPVLRGEAYTRSPPVIMVQSGTGIAAQRSIMEDAYKYIDFGGGSQAFYNVTLDLPEATNLLSGILTVADQTALHKLQTGLETFKHNPRISSVRLDESNRLNATIGWYNHPGLTLWRTESNVSTNWIEVAGQEFKDAGTASLLLRDPSPPAGPAFYRITAP